MEDVCNSQMCALYCLHSVISQPQPWHGEEGPISAAGTVFFFQLCCILAAEENDSDPQCQHNGYIFHIYVLSVKELRRKKKKRQDMHHHHTVLAATKGGSLLPLVILLMELKKKHLHDEFSGGGEDDTVLVFFPLFCSSHTVKLC